MQTKLHHIGSLLQKKNLYIGSLALVAMTASFGVGLRSSGSIQPVSLTEAGASAVPGDMNDDGDISTDDVVIILEIVQGYTVATPEQLQADPNGDGLITIDDAILLLSDLALL